MSELPDSLAALRVVDPFSNGPCVSHLVREETGLYPVNTGTIAKVIADRGFGFIAADDGKQYFFHRDGLAPTLVFDALSGGERVSFEIEANAKGPRAVQVRKA